ncbi:MATE family efflux transporter [Acetobacteraceae bacterium H6797]|nr:MATE family efflux transporter [Acetobacteraceae bacterium H6797]
MEYAGTYNETQTGKRSAGWRQEIRATLALAWPLALTNLSQMALVLTDTIYLGHFSTDALAASTLGANLYWAALALPFGITFGAAAMLAQEKGRKTHHLREMRRTVRQAIWVVMLTALPILALLWNTRWLLEGLGQEPALAALAQDYVRVLMWGLLPFFGFAVLRGFLAALERPGPALWISLAAIALNAALGAVFIFGGLGLPPMGIVGAGLASALSNLAMFGGLAVLIARDRRLSRYRLAGRFWRTDWRRMGEILKLGLPVAGQMLLEIAIFSAAGIAMGWMGATAVAAHAIALQMAAAAFMVPMGVGQAATARVGLAMGAGDRRGAARAGWCAIGIAAGFMALSALALIFFNERFAWAFLREDDPAAMETAAVAAGLVVIAGLFQLGDGVQVAATGALRGMKDTRVPMLLAALGYWAIAMPAGLALAFPAGLGPSGLWWGLAGGLAVVASLMTLRWHRLARRGGLTARRRLAPMRA